MVPEDIHFMNLAYAYAESAAEMGEVPVGAVLVAPPGIILAAAGNDCIQSCDPTGHAEIHALRLAGLRLRNYRFPGATMYVTLEPCAMCAAAMVHARVRRLVIGADDPKTGAVYSRYAIGSDGKLNHGFQVHSGVLQDQCSRILKEFFRKRR